jgi:hypothetical protein
MSSMNQGAILQKGIDTASLEIYGGAGLNSKCKFTL